MQLRIMTPLLLWGLLSQAAYNYNKPGLITCKNDSISVTVNTVPLLTPTEEMRAELDMRQAIQASKNAALQKMAQADLQASLQDYADKSKMVLTYLRDGDKTSYLPKDVSVGIAPGLGTNCETGIPQRERLVIRGAQNALAASGANSEYQNMRSVLSINTQKNQALFCHAQQSEAMVLDCTVR